MDKYASGEVQYTAQRFGIMKKYPNFLIKITIFLN